MTFNKNIVIILSGQFVSQLGDKIYMLALSYYVLESTGSSAMMGLVLSSALFPSLILGFFSGTFIDRYNKKNIIVSTDIIRGMVISGITVAYLMNTLTLPVIIISQILLSINAAFFDPAIPSVIPLIVKENQLTRANSLTQFIRGITTIIGPILGGIAVAYIGYTVIFIFNALSFFISGIFESFLRIPDIKKEKTITQSVLQDLLEGYTFILSDMRLVIIIIMVSVIHFFVGSTEVIIPVFASVLKGNSAQNMGSIQSAFGAGTILMACIISIVTINQKEVKLLFSAVFCVGLLFISIVGLRIAGFSHVIPFMIIFLLIGSFIILAGTCFKSILQKNVPQQMMGRVFGFVSSVGNGSIPFSMMVYGFLLSHFSFNKLLIITGVILLPLSIFCYYSYKGVNNAGNCQSGTRTNGNEN